LIEVWFKLLFLTWPCNFSNISIAQSSERPLIESFRYDYEYGYEIRWFGYVIFSQSYAIFLYHHVLTPYTICSRGHIIEQEVNYRTLTPKKKAYHSLKPTRRKMNIQKSEESFKNWEKFWKKFIFEQKFARKILQWKAFKSGFPISFEYFGLLKCLSEKFNCPSMVLVEKEKRNRKLKG
jgi:hypothetical protein